MRLPASFFAFLGLLFSLHMFAHVDPDLFFHIKEGEKLIEQGRFPLTEEFSFTAPGKAMVATEWLAHAEIYSIFQAFGYSGLVFVHTLLFLAALVVLFHFLKGDVPEPTRYFLVSLAAFALLNFVAVRAHVFTILFMSLFLLWIRRWEEGKRWAPWAMAGSLLFWVNVHGGFMAGWGMLLLVCLLSFKQSRKTSDLAPIALGTFLCFLHPNGPTAFVYPLWFMVLPPDGRSIILEWMPLDFAQASATPYLLILGVLCLVGLGGLRRKFPWAALTLGLLLLSLRGRKLLPLFSLTAIAALGLSLRQTALKKWQTRLSAVGAVAVLLALSALEVGFARGKPWRDWEGAYPKAAAEFFAGHYAGRRLFHDYSWGCYLIYKLAPATKVFIDGRLDPYWSLLGDYSVMMEGRPGWRALLDSWAIEAALVSPNTPLAQLLGEDRRWRSVYRDPKAVLYIRK